MINNREEFGKAFIVELSVGELNSIFLEVKINSLHYHRLQHSPLNSL